MKRNPGRISVNLGSCSLCEVCGKFCQSGFDNLLHYLILPHCLIELGKLHSQIFDWCRWICRYSVFVTRILNGTFRTFCRRDVGWWKHLWLTSGCLCRWVVTLSLWTRNDVVSVTACFSWFQVTWHFLLRLFYYRLHQNYFLSPLFRVVIYISINIFRIFRFDWLGCICELLTHVSEKKLVNIIQIIKFSIVWLQAFGLVALASAFKVCILQMISTAILSQMEEDLFESRFWDLWVLGVNMFHYEILMRLQI